MFESFRNHQSLIDGLQIYCLERLGFMQISLLQNDKNLTEIVQKLKAHFHPSKIYLFGSRANGTAKSDSDYDLFLIIKDSAQTKIERMQEANQVLWGRSVSVDVFIYTEAEFNSFNDDINSIANTVSAEGLEL